MKKILILVIILLQLRVYAQENSKWDFGFDFAVDELSNIERIQINHNSYAVEFDKFNYTIGFTTGFKINQKFKVSSGILFSNKDFTGTYYNYIPTVELLIYEPEIIKSQFLNIPLSVNYSFLNEKIRPVLELGFNNNIELKNDLNDLSKGYFLEAFVGASIYYGLTESLQAGIGYNYITALSDLYKTDEFNLKTNSFFVKINYDLK